MQKIHFSIVTPERTVYESDVDEVILPTIMGEIGLLPNHIPLVSQVSAGEIRIKKENNEIDMVVGQGFVEVRPGNTVVLLADAAERAEEISLERAEAAKKRVEQLIQEKKFANDVEFAGLQAALERSVARIKISKRHRHAKH